MSATELLKSLAVRRTVYQLSKKDFPIKHDRVVEIVREIVAQTPSSFNNQTTRAIILFGDDHDKLWNEITGPAIKAVVPPEQWEQSKGKIEGFAAAYGTVLFFEDVNTIKATQDKFAAYADNFPIWASQSSGAAQILTWTALATENVGANLQHYNGLIDKQVSSTFKVPDNWKLTAQLVFGSKAGEPYPKETLPGTETVRVA